MTLISRDFRYYRCGEESQKEEEASTEFSPCDLNFARRKGKENMLPYALSLSLTHTFEKEAFTPSRDFFPSPKTPVQRKGFFFVCAPTPSSPSGTESETEFPSRHYVLHPPSKPNIKMFIFPLFFFWGMCGGGGNGFLSLACAVPRSVAAAENRAKKDAKGVWEEYHVLFPPSLTSKHPFP